MSNPGRKRRIFGSVTAVSLAAASACAVDDPAPLMAEQQYAAEVSIEVVEAFPGVKLDAPAVLFASSYSRGRWFAGSADGKMSTFYPRPGQAATVSTYGDLSPKTDAGDGIGLLSMAMHPSFRDRDKRFVFAAYTARDGASKGGVTLRVSQFGTNGSRAFVVDDETVLLEVAIPSRSDVGGGLVFDRDGRLVVGIGSGGSGDGELHGSVVAIDLSDRSHEVLASGFRSPSAVSVDRETGALWVADSGAGAEHVYRIGADGASVRVTSYRNPSGTALVGGAVYRGEAVPALVGKYVFADRLTGAILAVDAGAPAGTEPALLLETELAPSAIATDFGGELCFLDIDRGSGHMLALAGTKAAGRRSIGPQRTNAASKSSYAPVLEIFERRCARCHGRGQAGGLGLRSDNAHQELVGVAAEVDDCSGRTRVVPGKPEESLLISKLTGENLCGSPMPPRGERVPPEEIEAIKAWIQAGAPAQ